MAGYYTADEALHLLEKVAPNREAEIILALQAKSKLLHTDLLNTARQLEIDTVMLRVAASAYYYTDYIVERYFRDYIKALEVATNGRVFLSPKMSNANPYTVTFSASDSRKGFFKKIRFEEEAARASIAVGEEKDAFGIPLPLFTPEYKSERYNKEMQHTLLRFVTDYHSRIFNSMSLETALDQI